MSLLPIQYFPPVVSQRETACKRLLGRTVDR